MSTRELLRRKHGRQVTTSAKTDKYYLLVIAIDHYQDANIPVLYNPLRDAAKVLQELIGEYRFGSPGDGFTDLRDTDPRYADKTVYTTPIPVYDTPEIACLYNEKATNKGINDRLRAMYARMGENDALLVYYAGHGIYVDEMRQFYLAVHNSQLGDETSYLADIFLYKLFSDYQADKKCRNLLLMLDCCFAGGIESVYNPKRSLKEPYSRHVCTSAAQDQAAADGMKGAGSPFANAFCELLKGNSNPELAFDVFAFGKLQSTFKMSLKNGHRQDLSLGNLPVDNTGNGSFIFEKLEKDKPDIVFIRDSFIDHLDFEEPRLSLRNMFDDSRNHLNIFVTPVYSYRLHNVLTRIIFRQLRDKRRNIHFDPSKCFMSESIHIGHFNGDDIWGVLHRQLKMGAEDAAYDKHTVFGWFFQKLRGEGPEFEGKSHVIIRLHFAIGGEELLQHIRDFCRECSRLFLQHKQSIPATEWPKYGKMFIIFSDERIGSAGFGEEHFSDLPDLDAFNLVTSRMPSPIRKMHVETWIEKVTEANESNRIKALLDQQVGASLTAPKQGSAVFSCTYEEFVLAIAEYCGYSMAEKTVLENYLYHPSNSFI